MTTATGATPLAAQPPASLLALIKRIDAVLDRALPFKGTETDELICAIR